MSFINNGNVSEIMGMSSTFYARRRYLKSVYPTDMFFHVSMLFKPFTFAIRFFSQCTHKPTLNIIERKK